MSATPTPTLAIPEGLALQPRAARTLQRTLAARSSHAFLLSGARGAGAHDAAVWLACASLCPNGGCDACDVCRRVKRRVHPDLIWLRAEGQQLAREQIDNLVEQLVRKPFEAQMQVAVIDDADTLSSRNPITGNALLKVLEEPPGDVLFVLLAERASMLLPTLRSRVIEVPFPPVPDERMLAHLVEVGMNDALLAGHGLTLDQLIRIAGGDVGRAHELANGGPALQRRRVATAVAAGLAGGRLHPSDAVEQLLQCTNTAQQHAIEVAEREFAAQLEQLPPKDAARFKNSKDSDGMESRIKRRGRRAMSEELRLLLSELAGWYRDLLAVSNGAPEAVRNVDSLSQLDALAGTPAALRVVAALDSIEELPGRLTTNVDIPIALAAMCAELAGLASNRIRSRRTLSSSTRTPQGLDLAL